jgi:hypothetical protein
MSLHGFYSQEYDSKNGHVIYNTPDGREVKITLVCTSDPPQPGLHNFTDLVSIGPVTNYVRGFNKVNDTDYMCVIKK